MSRREVLQNFEKYAEETEARIAYGIETYRKGNFRINLVDEEGKPVQGAKIKLSQKTHEFKYGANLFMLDELETEEKNEKYKQYLRDTFNIATLPFYWDALEPEKGKQRYAKDSPKIYRRPAIDKCIEFCEESGIEPREHALAYDFFFPDWVKKLPVNEVKRELSRRFKEIAERYADKIPTIEVTNEMFWASEVESSFYDDDNYIEWCFQEAEKYFPNNQLVINEWTEGVWLAGGRNRDAYYMMIERALRKGARIDAIGMQYHMFYRKENELQSTLPFYNPRVLYKILDRYSDFQRPIQITEVTVPAYTYEKEDEELQAEILRKLYRLWFSHERVEQIVYWNLVDGYAAFAKQGDFDAGENYYRGGLIRFDFTPKPAYFAIKDLFEKEWHTEAEVETDENGCAYFKGFYGNYVATVNGKEYEIRALKGLPTDGKCTKRIQIKL